MYSHAAVLVFSIGAIVLGSCIRAKARGVILALGLLGALKGIGIMPMGVEDFSLLPAAWISAAMIAMSGRGFGATIAPLFGFAMLSYAIMV